MNNDQNNKQKSKLSILPTLLIIMAVLAFNAADDPARVMPVLAVLLIAAAFVAIVGTVKKTAGNKESSTRLRPDHAEHPTAPRSMRGKSAATRAKSAMLTHKDEQEAEEAVGCHHARGKEKYIQQLDSYLKAGLIDKAEYKLMKERYSKLEIPDDYH